LSAQINSNLSLAQIPIIFFQELLQQFFGRSVAAHLAAPGWRECGGRMPMREEQQEDGREHRYNSKLHRHFSAHGHGAGIHPPKVFEFPRAGTFKIL
jgi:hypothetical protein